MPGASSIEYHVPRLYQLCKTCPWCQAVKGDYTDPKTKPGTIIAIKTNGSIVCWFFIKVDPLKDGKENILVLTDAFTKFS